VRGGEVPAVAAAVRILAAYDSEADEDRGEPVN